MQETIFALSTPQGVSGVAVMRVSGGHAFDVVRAITKKDLPPFRQASLRTLYDPRSQSKADHESVIDRAVVLCFEGPHSFTGEDVAELHIHGSRAVIESLSEILASLDHVRMAEPGEFTRRAFEQGKMDLTEAEAIQDLIHAETSYQRQQALMQMDGALASLYHGWADELAKALAHCEAVLDFPDEDVPDEESLKILPAVASIAKEMEEHLHDNRRGERLRDGIHVALVGAPNAGKSSLINHLAQRDVAIVSDIAGTTRDVLDVHLDIGGYPLILSDTAGLRPSELSEKTAQDSIELEGIKRALDKARQADITILLLDGNSDALDNDTMSLRQTLSNTISVLNKSDSISSGMKTSLDETKLDPVFISVKTGENMQGLLDALLAKVEELYAISRETPSLTRQRHRTYLEESLACLQQAGEETSPELLAESLRMALRSLGRITGRVDVEDLLDIIFRDFCIGK